uniref:NADH-ubiquinone oxidoreductase chain 5 n=1 Tax=Thelepus plagiostoma TaxID=1084972 RepID=A0A8B6QMF6_9ANNE|nr:NADH dehydrogenase subunit 5 [Thelepus plagiostoma]QTJ29899.1 NADH dehydrogenase subunit 5 [Thelepus plagiostoma]
MLISLLRSTPPSQLFLVSLLLIPISLKSILSNSILLIEWQIFSMNSSVVILPIIFDPYSLLFMMVLLNICSHVLFFSKSYMKSDPFFNRFTMILMLFIVSMIMLILIPNMWALLLGWDGLGFTSFALVVYYSNPRSLGAGMITALTNRVGDAFILLAIAWTLMTNNWSIINMWESNMSPYIVLAIMLAAMTKSAQIPFSSWLPAAMAAPTPVSALVHSSTLVTAGIFLLIRFFPFASSFPWFQPTLLITASMTMFMAGLSAMTECDLKKIIALSTLSQLGVMMASIALGFPKLAMFHLITHAMFKALLFICAGTMIHFNNHTQDLRTMGNLSFQLPSTMTCLTVANMSLSGLPFLSGFYSKDLILETSFFNPINIMPLILLIAATGLTIAYSMRLSIMSLWGPQNSSPLHHLSNEDLNILVPTSFLTLGAITTGTLLNWIMSPFFFDPVLPLSLKTTPLFITVLSAMTAWFIFSSSDSSFSSLLMAPISHEASCEMWYMSPIASQSTLTAPLHIAHQFHKTLDHGWLELTGPQGIWLFIYTWTKTIQPIQKNSISIFLYLMFVSLLIPIFML